MSKYNNLWKYVQASEKDNLVLTYDDIKNVLGFEIDHSFLTFKKELIEYGYEVGKISMKNHEVIFNKIK